MKGIVVNAGAQGGINPSVIAQGPGESPLLVMSQKAVTDYVKSLGGGGSLGAIYVPTFSQELCFTGEEIEPTFNDYSDDYLKIEGTTSAVDAGRYTVTFTPKPGYVWLDGTVSAVDVTWEIKRAPGELALSASSGTTDKAQRVAITATAHTGAVISAESSNGSIAAATVSGNTVTVIGGNDFGTAEITVTASQTQNYEAATATYVVENYLGTLDLPTTTDRTYNGSSQGPDWDGFVSAAMTSGGTDNATDAGTYSAAVTPKPGYRWRDGSTGAKTVTWSIARKKLTAVPSQKTALTYTGAEQTVAWNNCNPTELSLSGTTKSTNAGEYSANFTPTKNYAWSDGSTNAKTIKWTIGKAAGTMTLSAESLLILNTSENRTFTVNCNTGGTLSVSSSAAGVATASVSGTTVTVTSQGYGTATLTVTAAATTNYNAVSKTCAVSVTKKADLKPADIKAVIDNGQASNVFSVGDLFPIKWNGKMSDGLTLNNETYYACIIGINHNPDVEGSNRVHFKAPYDSTGKQLAWCDSKYNTGIGTGQSTTSGKYFNMNNATSGAQYGYNGGGYVKSNMKVNIMPLIKAAMEESWRNIIRPCTKYSDNNNIAAGTIVPDTAANVTATQEDVWLLDEFEYHGARTYANSASKNYQRQYQYYINGSPKIHYKHSSTGTAVYALCRGVYVGNLNHFCAVSASGSATIYYAYNSYGVAVGFTV